MKRLWVVVVMAMVVMVMFAAVALANDYGNATRVGDDVNATRVGDDVNATRVGDDVNAVRAMSNATSVGSPFFPGILPGEVFVGNFTAAKFDRLSYATKRFAGAEEACRTMGFENEPTGSMYHPVYISREEPLKK